jgi:hypothetical protein
MASTWRDIERFRNVMLGRAIRAMALSEEMEGGEE